VAFALLAVTGAVVAGACSGAPAEPASPPVAALGPSADHAAAPVPVPVATPPSASPTEEATDAGIHAPDAGPPASVEAPAPHGPEPSACPADMVLIDGEYCTDLDLKCKKSSYAPQNHKTICHEFESPSKCVGDKVKKRYCIDKFEYPNKKGERPITMNDFPHAQRLCAAQGKRVCTESEWTMACEGPTYKPYPYGYVRDPKKCNGDRPYIAPDVKKTVSKNKDEARAEVARLWQGVPSGSQPECVSDYGVWDMPGNVDELASSEQIGGKHDKFDNVTTGGPWLSGVRNQCRPKIYDHNEGFAYYYLSFRCCEEADGKPTDPRSPKQIKRGEKFKSPPRTGK